jgi:hypothetical protein
MFENKVLGPIFGLNTKETRGKWTISCVIKLLMRNYI